MRTPHGIGPGVDGRLAMSDPLLLTTAAAAQRLGISSHTLVDWRRPYGQGPDLPWVQVGRRVFYRADDVRQFLDRRVHRERMPAAVTPAYPLLECGGGLSTRAEAA